MGLFSGIIIPQITNVTTYSNGVHLKNNSGQPWIVFFTRDYQE